MRQIGDSRIITVDKDRLIKVVLENKAKHIKEYAEAVEAYKVEAAKQIKQLRRELAKGNLDLKLDLVTPENREAEYDKIKATFDWEVKPTVELSQGEFNQYVLDELPFAVKARMSNMFYKKI